MSRPFFGGQEFLVSMCGLVTSLLAGVISWWVETRFGVAVYSYMWQLAIPIGAFLTGVAGASGYLYGAKRLGHRPTSRLPLNMVLASAATFLLIHYLSYATMKFEGTAVSDVVPFTRYLDISFRTTTFRLGPVVPYATTGELGSFGYVLALVQVLGFTAGGLAVYRHLAKQAHCGTCSRYLTLKGQLMRYTDDEPSLHAQVARLAGQIAQGDVTGAMAGHAAFGQHSPEQGEPFRVAVRVQCCLECGRHWVKVAAEHWNQTDWKEIGASAREHVTFEPIGL